MTFMKSEILFISRADWIRTSDPYVPNVVRYRAALLPEKRAIIFNEMTTLTSLIVGWTGFEPATTCTPYKCATGLRHHPNFIEIVEIFCISTSVLPQTGPPPARIRNRMGTKSKLLLLFPRTKNNL